MKNDFVFKVLLLGDSSVGKSTLLIKSTEDEYLNDFYPTIGVDLKIKDMKYEKKNVRLHIWDTAGQERFRTIVDTYYRDANAIILCYDITNYASFDNLKYWITNITNKCDDNIYKIIVGLKTDLHTARQVKFKDGKEFAKNNSIDFIEISSKNLNIFSLEKKLYKPIVQKLIKLNMLGPLSANNTEGSNLIVRNKKPKARRRKKSFWFCNII